MIYPDRDEDLYEIMSSLKLGQMSEYIRNAIRASAGMPVEQVERPARRKSRRASSSVSATTTPVQAQAGSGGLTPERVTPAEPILPPLQPSASGHMVSADRGLPSPPASPAIDDEDLERLRALNKMFL